MKGIRGIPHAVVVDGNGIVAWTGHPLNGMDEVLEQVAEGRFDVSKAKAQTTLEYYQQVLRVQTSVK